MDIKEEIALLERKVELMKQYVELMEKAKVYENSRRIEYVPCYPSYPNYPTYPPTYYYGTITSGGFS